MNRSLPEVISPALDGGGSAGVLPEEIAPKFASDIAVLTKARLSSLVLITTFVGFCMASRQGIDWLTLLHTLLGTALVAGSAAVLNQLMETNVDRLMERTKDRPLPSGRMSGVSALRIGILMAVAGFLYLALAVNLLSAYLAAATLFIYLALYTPLKRKTSFCIIVGAVSGAIPPLIGWTAARASFGAGSWILFGVLFLWQIPHFLAIAWMYRDEYAQAGFVMLRRNDICGVKTATEGLLFTLGLIGVTLVPVLLGLATPIYLAGALVFDALLLGCSAQFLFQRTRASARRLFFATILYLPCLLGLMVFTKV